MPVPECPTKYKKTRVPDTRCQPQNEDCQAKEKWLRHIDSEYKCPFDQPLPEIPEPPPRVPDSDCPEGPYRDPVIVVCPTVCECFPDLNIDDSWRGNPKDFCFAYKNRYRNLRNAKTNKRCQILIKRQQAILQAMREKAEKDMLECRIKARKAAEPPPKLDCKSLFYVDYSFKRCLCEKCKLAQRIKDYIASLGCAPPKPGTKHDQIPGCGPRKQFPCNTYYNPKQKDKCACRCGCLEKIQDLYDMQNKQKKK